MSGGVVAIEQGAPRERSALVAGGISLLLASVLGVAGFAASVPAAVVTGTALFLFLAVASDVHSHRLPNRLTLPALLVALAVSPWALATSGPLEALVGAGLALALLIAPYAIGGIGAGDVKASMALGAWLGPVTTLGAVAWAAIAAGAFGLVLLAVNREIGAFAHRWGRNVLGTLALRRITYEGPPSGTCAAGGIPFAAAIGVGLAVQWSVGSPW